MNTLMYEHPLTEQHIRVVREVIGYTVLGPIGKKLACGDIGESVGPNRAVSYGPPHETARADLCGKALVP